MEGHLNNVSFAVFHPNLPLIVSGSEDGTVKIWNSGTYRLENTLSYALERAWCVALKKGSNDLAVGYDEGVVVVKVILFIHDLLALLSIDIAWTR
jgi:coatomer subunit beta'